MDLARLGVDADRDDRAGLAGESDREIERVGVPDGVDRGVDAAALGAALGRRRAGSPRSGGRASRRTLRATSSRSATVSIANTGPAPAATRDLHRAQPDRAEPEHGDAVAGRTPPPSTAW